MDKKLTDEEIFSLADVHADETREDGVRELSRSGLLAFVKDLAERASNPASPSLNNYDALYKAWHKIGADVAGLIWQDFVAAISAAPSPVATSDTGLQVYECGSGLEYYANDDADKVIAALAAGAPQPQAEPVGYVFGGRYWEADNLRMPEEARRLGSPRYAAPPATAAAPSVQEATLVADFLRDIDLLDHPDAGEYNPLCQQTTENASVLDAIVKRARELRQSIAAASTAATKAQSHG